MRFRDHVTLLLESRRRRLLAAALVAVVLAAIGGAVWATDRGGGPVAMDDDETNVFECPMSAPPTGAQVPAPPAVPVVDGRLVPLEMPDVIALCEYPAGGGAVVLPRQLGGTEAAAVPLLAALHAATAVPSGSTPCPGPVATAATSYLAGLAFGSRVVWVATPDACGGSTNGPSSTSTDLSEPIAAALATLNGGAPSPPATGTGR